MKNTVATFRNSKSKGEKISMITAYDYSTAKILDECGVDSILVGDSLGMVFLGYNDTLSVTMEDMLHHTKAVRRGVDNALLISDMPFMSYQTSVYDAIKNAGRLVQEAGADCIKLEGGMRVAEQIEGIVNAQIPVIGHIGLTPQSVKIFGGFKVQGRKEDLAEQLIEDALRIEEAGAFGLVVECIPGDLAKRITEAVSIPTIGIGGGVHCDGQVLVYHDMLNMYQGIKPKFAKIFANAGDEMRNGFKRYIEEVKGGMFPDDEHTF